jgi:Tol biopolymer transport system component
MLKTLPVIPLGIALGFALVLRAQDQKKSDPDPAQEAKLLANTRQLTFEGKRAGEGYFSKDGRQLIFQSEREEGNPFYQIYRLDLETGDTERVSPGHGKTTCAWIHPDGKKVLFGSTQDDTEAKKKQKDEIEFRDSGQARKYTWDYDEHFEIFEFDPATKAYTNLTKTRGYDAEGCYSPDGGRIVFASNRQAYEPGFSEEDAKFFKLDQKFPMELYVMNSDGSNVKRLTNADGYDGGPFFNADGTKICWRRFDRKGLTAEVFTMNADGTGEKQLTRLGAMSWAPFFHPSGEYLIFTTNKHGFDNFELYLVDAAGEREPVRVSHTPGFDGLPAFSPDGKKLAWTSNRTASKQSQLFMAEWNHEAARALLGLGQTTKEAAPAGAKRPDFTQTEADITVEDLRKHVTYLASDELKGRMTGTPGEIEATAYVASVFEKLGLEPAGEKGTWFQPFTFTAGVAVGKDNSLDLSIGGKKIEGLTADKDWRPVSFSKNGPIDAGGIVFAGYGMEIPKPNGDGEAYTSYFHLDVKGKWVMVLRYFPEDAPKELREEMQRFSRLRHKAMTARRKFAAGVIFVSGPNSKVKDQLVPMEYDASMADSGIPAISITTELAQQILAGAGKDLKALQSELDGGEMAAGFPIPDAKLAARIDVAQESRTGRNVLARLPAATEAARKKPAVIIGAHVDHLGDKAGPGSLAKEHERNEVHHGADDNASGIAGLLEMAQSLAAQKKEGKLDAKRDVMFAAWSGEELGLIGSSWFVKSIGHDKESAAAHGNPHALPPAKKGAAGANPHAAPANPHAAPAPDGDGLSEHFAAYLNMDMIGRLDKALLLQGIGSSAYWEGAIERRNAPIGLAITTQKDVYLPTDATTFYLRQVPILSAFTGAHTDYHTPRDTADKVNYEGARDIAKLMTLIARGLAVEETEPAYVKVEPPKNQGARGFRVYLGTVPDYAQGDIKGVKLSGVASDGPTAKAGVQGGDIIIGLGGKEILNIYDYTAVLAELKVGVETTIKVKRGDKELEMKLTPGSRD